jgi:predicted secreted Zn-dependent protease
MRIVASVAILFFAAGLAYADGPKSCEELKSEIAKKLEANGAKAYTLEIVAKDKDAKGKVVGTCGGGTMKIVYSKPAAAPKPAAPAPKKP